MRFHNLRHTYASLLIAQEEHSKYIQNQLGHSSINVTMEIYGHLMETLDQRLTSQSDQFLLYRVTVAWHRSFFPYFGKVANR